MSTKDPEEVTKIVESKPKEKPREVKEEAQEENNLKETTSEMIPQPQVTDIMEEA